MRVQQFDRERPVSCKFAKIKFPKLPRRLAFGMVPWFFAFLGFVVNPEAGWRSYLDFARTVVHIDAGRFLPCLVSYFRLSVALRALSGTLLVYPYASQCLSRE